LRVALCQVQTEPWETEQNLLRTIASLEEAAKKGAELAITPECVLHGYPKVGPDDYERVRAAAESLDGHSMTTLRATARRLQMHVIVGFAERGKGQDIYNSAALIARTGEILSVYRKVHCREFESIEHDGFFTPGDAFYTAPVQTDNGLVNLGTMICFDREIPESARSLRSLGATLIACPLATDTCDALDPAKNANNEMVTRVRACENEVYIAVINHARRFNGGSFIVGPEGEVLHQMGADAGVDVVDVPVEAVPSRFHDRAFGWMNWGFRRPAVYGKYLA